jgi:hypothetical protein
VVSGKNVRAIVRATVSDEMCHREATCLGHRLVSLQGVPRAVLENWQHEQAVSVTSVWPPRKWREWLYLGHCKLRISGYELWSWRR